MQVDIVGTTPGAHVNTTGDLTSSSGNSGTANDTLTVNQAGTTTTITADAPDPSDVNQAVIVAYTVVANAPGSGTPTGTVMVDDGEGNTCSATVAAGQCTLTSTTPGNKTLTATYAGATSFNPSGTAETHTVQDLADLVVQVVVEQNPLQMAQGPLERLLSPAEAIAQTPTPLPVLVYRTTETNLGPGPAVNVVVTSPTPAGFTFVSNTGACTTPFPCQLGTLTALQSVDIVTTLNTTTAFDQTMPIVLMVTATSDTTDPQPATATVTVTVLAPGIPTLPQWGLLLLTLSLLTLATWQLVGQPARTGQTSTGAAALLPASSHWPSSLLLGQGVAAAGLLLYALFSPLVAHDGVGVLLAGLLIGVMIELYRCSE